MEHVVARVRLFIDERCETQILAVGGREECERMAEAMAPTMEETDPNVTASHLVVREKRDWDTITAGLEADEIAARGRKLS